MYFELSLTRCSLQNNVASMEEEVGKVVKSMDVITEKSESINVALAPHRSKVEKLIGVRRLLKRLEFIFDLPQRLNTYVLEQSPLLLLFT